VHAAFDLLVDAAIELLFAPSEEHPGVTKRDRERLAVRSDISPLGSIEQEDSEIAGAILAQDRAFTDAMRRVRSSAA
jgi:hypothetical protein